MRSWTLPRLRGVLVGGLLAALAPPSAAPAQIPVAGWGGGSLELGGYVRALAAVHDLDVDPPEGLERLSAFGGQVIRLKWTARGAGGGWVLEVHDRLQARISSADRRGGAGVGFGVSAVPGRSVDLETTFLEEDRFRVWHDLDRLALTVYTDAADVTVGRQAITWGTSALFPVADLWSRFSPFELDTEEKPGVDAVRALAYPGRDVEVDAVVADRGTLDDLSVGVRATWSLPSGDVWAGAGKFWREAVALVGGSLLLEEVKLRVEAALPWEIDDADGDGDEGADEPRVTAGADWLPGRWVLSAEAHFNGIGVDDAGAYASLLAADPRLARGETYYLGRWYAGAHVGWEAGDRFTLSATVLANLGDPSAAVTPNFGWDVGQSARVSVGGLLPLGEAPTFLPSGVPVLRSEFGSYGTLGWTRLSVYF